MRCHQPHSNLPFYLFYSSAVRHDDIAGFYSMEDVLVVIKDKPGTPKCVKTAISILDKQSLNSDHKILR